MLFLGDGLCGSDVSLASGPRGVGCSTGGLIWMFVN